MANSSTHSPPSDLKLTWGSPYPALKVSFFRRHARLLMSAAVAFSDLLSITIAGGLAVFLRFLPQGRAIPQAYSDLIPLVLLALFIFALTGLYSFGLGPVEELRRVTLATSVIFLSLAALSFWMRSADVYSRASFLLAWIFSLFLIPTGRELLRLIAIQLGMWGEPVVVIGYGVMGYEIAEYLVNTPKSSLNPIVAVDRRREDRTRLSSIPIVRADDITENESLGDWFSGIQTAILVIPEISETFYRKIMDDHTMKFNRLIIVSSAQHAGSNWVRPYDIGGILGLEVGQNLLSKWQKAVKRIIDLGLIFLALPILIPLFAIISYLIRLDSKGRTFYSHPRIGHDGKLFDMWKFRTMRSDADKILQTYLVDKPELQAEWNATHKLKNDPRVTQFGKLLRKFSLDEFPQLINVLKGEMSLVGPRPIVERETEKYGKSFKLYQQVVPGMTGLWQISGRSDISYQSRVGMDEYYVRNWSIWMDVHILSRTALVVLKGTGSY
jgi:Undecaprenyl-phosphate galactose phosphotransferase WbaP